MPRPLDFSNLTEYFVQKAVVLAISLLNDDRPEPVSHRLLLNLLKNNDNSNNAYSDCYFVGSLITALGNALTTVSPRSSSGQQLIEELKRYATMDCLIPSYHNVVTVSCLQTFTRLYLAKVLPSDLKMLMHHSRYGNFLHVRMAAFDGLLLLDGLLIPKVRTYLLSTIEVDPDRYLRGYIATNIARLTAIYLGKQAELTSLPVRWVQFQKCPEVRTTLHRILTNPHLDPRLRRTLNILCGLLYPSSHCPLNLTAFQIRINEAFPNKSKLIASLPSNSAPPSHASPPATQLEQPPLTTQVVASPLPLTPALRPMTPSIMSDEDMKTVMRLMRRLYGHDKVNLFLDNSQQQKLFTINSKVKKNQYSSLEHFQSDFDAMFAYYKDIHHGNDDLIKDIHTFEAFYRLQFRKLQEDSSHVPPVRLHLNPPRPPSPEKPKITLNLSRSTHPVQETPPQVVPDPRKLASTKTLNRERSTRRPSMFLLSSWTLPKQSLSFSL
ncbi:hypothetical protein DSO57_1037225 [Entomophthora muscae]|uniref:Uncharacterized protein n=1 Tax=Entomophthora muscae TaxID=34485 RepID=A0ACC2U8R5_9FUNG|nr:hypothetical protein DSO57_1037225 [Entomophthora muscae]